MLNAQTERQELNAVSFPNSYLSSQVSDGHIALSGLLRTA